jgi:hypothetical protein
MDSVTEIFQEFHRRRAENIAKAFGVDYADIQKSEDDDISKASDNPFDAAAEEDIEKSDIMEAISYDDNFRIAKSGKEIKEQIQNVILPKKQAELAVKKGEADDLLEECGAAPTKDVCKWWLGNMDIECGYKYYDWEETCMKCDKGGEVYSSLSYENQEGKPKCNCPETIEEAQARRKYNDTVNIICNILVDIKACEILTKNLSDDATIKLTPRQIVAFDFD